MAKKKLGIGTIEINKKFESREEAYKYAKRLIEKIRSLCEKNKDRGWHAQAMVVSSNLRSDVGILRYEISGKRGRPKKKHDISNVIGNNWYKGNYYTDWHLHILIVSNPSYMFRNIIKNYIDKNWNDVPNLNEKKAFDVNKYGLMKVYKKKSNIKISDYFLLQGTDMLFCNCNYGEEEKLKYSLKEYYREYMKMDSAKRRLCRRHIKKPLTEENYLKELNKIESKFNIITDYFLDITREQDDKENAIFMKEAKIRKIKENRNRNKVQDISRRLKVDDSIF